LRYVGASDANMEKGQMRVEVNISLRKYGDTAFGTKVEVKNINSFKYASDAAEYEFARQQTLYEQGKTVAQETRGWNEHTNETVSQRSKESAHDYRYFPEPDLPPLYPDADMVVELRHALPELPADKRVRFRHEFDLDDADMIDLLVREKEFAGYFENVASELDRHDRDTKKKPTQNTKKLAASLMTGDLMRLLKSASATASDTLITPENFAELALLIAEDRISHTAGKQVLEEMFRSGSDPSDIIDARGLWQISNTDDIADMARHVIKEFPDEVKKYKEGKEQVLQFLVGQIMKESRGKAKPETVLDVLRRALS
jgi:aspartyl-tRNA(Asn)/glutamyl-tRNA(Gln) amidotransferase subunit B